MLKTYIENKQAQLMNRQSDFYTSSGLHVFFKDPVENVDVEKVISKVERDVPDHLLTEIEMIIFGWFDEFEERSINAFYDRFQQSSRLLVLSVRKNLVALRPNFL